MTLNFRFQGHLFLFDMADEYIELTFTQKRRGQKYPEEVKRSPLSPDLPTKKG
ncbi:hypothetical protein J2X75_004716 [Paenibacillus sp. 2003]|nr:hypothetical protein [Paenibacillus sp. 2003]